MLVVRIKQNFWFSQKYEDKIKIFCEEHELLVYRRKVEYGEISYSVSGDSTLMIKLDAYIRGVNDEHIAYNNNIIDYLSDL